MYASRLPDHRCDYYNEAACLPSVAVGGAGVWRLLLPPACSSSSSWADAPPVVAAASLAAFFFSLRALRVNNPHHDDTTTWLQVRQGHRSGGVCLPACLPGWLTCSWRRSCSVGPAPIPRGRRLAPHCCQGPRRRPLLPGPLVWVRCWPLARLGAWRPTRLTPPPHNNHDAQPGCGAGVIRVPACSPQP